LEARHRLALNEGKKENREIKGNRERKSDAMNGLKKRTMALVAILMVLVSFSLTMVSPVSASTYVKEEARAYATATGPGDFGWGRVTVYTYSDGRYQVKYEWQLWLWSYQWKTKYILTMALMLQFVPNTGGRQGIVDILIYSEYNYLKYPRTVAYSTMRTAGNWEPWGEYTYEVWTGSYVTPIQYGYGGGRFDAFMEWGVVDTSANWFVSILGCAMPNLLVANIYGSILSYYAVTPHPPDWFPDLYFTVKSPYN
jgi:hypothetical protein